VALMPSHSLGGSAASRVPQKAHLGTGTPERPAWPSPIPGHLEMSANSLF